MNARLSVPARVEEWGGLRDALTASLAGAGVPPDIIDEMVLVSEEVFVNAVTHGGCDPAGPPVRVLIEVEEGALTLRFEDEGRAFDPLSRPAPDLDRADTERSEGGLGIHLMRELTDRMSYEREGRCNILILERRFPR